MTCVLVIVAILCIINRSNSTFFVNFFGDSFETSAGVEVETPQGTNVLTIHAYEDEITTVSLKQLTFEKGVYSFDFQYDTAHDGINFYIRSLNYLNPDNSNEKIFFEEEISPQNTYISGEITFDRAVNDTEVLAVLPAGATLSIGRVSFSSDEVYYNDYFVLLLLFIIGYLFFIYILFSKRTFCSSVVFSDDVISGRRAFFALSFVFLSLSFFIIYPMMHETFFGGHDFIYHLNRIEGIKSALLSGQFPVRIHPDQLAGYGYANGVFYPELFLYFPALLRILGMSLKNSYITFIFVINIMTVVLAYISFSRLFRSRYAGVLCAVVYALNPYRLANLYERSALGEFIAAAFFPVVLYGLYCIIFGDKKRWGWLVLGASGLLQSHILSTELALLFCVFVCLISIKRLFNNDFRFLSLIKAGVFCVLINLWFILPFLIMAVQIDIAVFNMSPVLSLKAVRDVDELFSIGFLSNYREAINGVATSGIGVTYLIATVMFCVYAILNYRVDARHKNLLHLGAFSTFVVVFFTFATTAFFPFDEVQSIPIIKDIIGAIQMPNRLIVFVMLFANVLVGVCLLIYTKKGKQRMYASMMAMIFTVVISWVYLNGVTVQPYHADFGTNSQTNIFQSGGLSIALGEYIPANSNIADALTRGTNIKTEHDISFKEVRRGGTDISFDYIINDFKEGEEYKILLPMVSYPKYVAEVNGRKYDTTAGGYNYVELTLQDEQGHADIGYEQPTLFKFSNIVSILAIAFLVGKNVFKEFYALTCKRYYAIIKFKRSQ